MPFPTDRLAGLALAMVLGLATGPACAQPAGGAEPAVRVGDASKIDAHDDRQVDERQEDGPLDEVGYAGVMSGADGAGEGAISAMHRTLPLPSYAEVTALATGRTILVQVTDRGPQANDRILDLSCGAVRQLGLDSLPAAVRVRRVNPPEQERARLRSGQRAAERMASPEGLLAALRRKLPPAPPPMSAGGCAPTSTTVAPSAAPDRPVSMPVTPPPDKAEPKSPQPAPKPLSSPQKPASSRPALVSQPKGPGYDIQVAAFASQAKASSLARRIGGRVDAAGAIFRVRKGPYPTEAAARAALPQIRAKGFADARVVTNGRR